MDVNIVDNVLALLHHYSLGAFLMEFLFNSRYDNSPHRQIFASQWPSLLDHLAHHPLLQKDTGQFVSASMTHRLTSEVTQLVDKESGWHFSAKNASSDQLEKFTINGMANRMQDQAPVLSSLLDCLLDSRRNRASYHEGKPEENIADELGRTAGSSVELDEEEEYWLGDEVDIEGLQEEDAGMNVDVPIVQAQESVESGDGSGDDIRAAQLKKRRIMAQKRKAALLAIVRIHTLFGHVVN